MSAFGPKADIALAATNFGFGGKADIKVDGPGCLLLTQSGHRGLLMSATETDTFCRFTKHLKYHRG
jgi:hypothetical protein